MRIVVDAMGGDFAPEVVIKGAVAAVKEYAVEVVLVGDENKIKGLLSKEKYPPSLISIYPSQEVIEMDESPAVSVRRKRNSSIVLGV